MKATRLCEFPDCGRPRSSRGGLCAGHVYQQRKGYDLTPIKPRRTTCTVDGCAGQHYSRGYCETHYGRFKRNGDPLTVKTGGAPRKPDQPCRIPDCDRLAAKNSETLCRSHHHRLRRYGDPTENRASRWYGVPFWDRVSIPDDPDACWEWQGPLYHDGRGQVQINGRRLIASRAAWEMVNGPIPPGMFACHHCDNPPCVRPDHLFLGTPKDNTEDMLRKGRAHWQKGNR